VVVPRYFVPALAGFMGMAALSLDSLLPAFPALRRAFDLPPDSTRVSLLITSFFFGMATGQLFYGPLSDRYGRKRPLLVGLAIFLLAGLGAVSSTSLAMMIGWRFLWGFGAAGPRSLTLAMIRDTTQGAAMARTMSLIMTIFVLVPVVAPALGSVLLHFGSWHVVFWLPIVFSVWMMFVLTKMPETLPPERRRSVQPSALWDAVKTIFRLRPTVGFGLAVVFYFGVMSSYIGGAEVIFDDVYHRGGQFPFIFGGIAICFGATSFLNARIVGRLGLPRVLQLGAVGAMASTGLLLIEVLLFHGKPPVALFVLGLVVMLPVVSGVVPNCNTAAMTPVPHVAGMATAVLGTTATAGGAVLGAVSNRAFHGTATPFAAFAFLFTCMAGAAIFVIAQPS
jgi:MFS transporter, DHA1 family, multidrug resistance protein